MSDGEVKVCLLLYSNCIFCFTVVRQTAFNVTIGQCVVSDRNLLLLLLLIIIINIIIIIIYPLSARVVGAPQMIFKTSFLHLSLFSIDLWDLPGQACPFPNVVLPPLLLSALSSSPFHCTLQDGGLKT